MDKDKNKKKGKKIIDLRRFLRSDMTMPDENGSYTGMPSEYYYEGIENEPIQDVDDL